MNDVSDLLISDDGKYLIYLDGALLVWDLKEKKNI